MSDGEDMAGEIPNWTAETDPTKSFIVGKDRVSLQRYLGEDRPVVKIVDKLLDARGQNDEAYQIQWEEIQKTGQAAKQLGLSAWVIKEAKAVLKSVPKGAEGRGGEIAKALLENAKAADDNAQEKLKQMVGEGKLTVEAANLVSGWVGVEMVRLAAHAQESSRHGGPRQDVMDAISPVTGQVNTETWNAGTWAAVVEDARINPSQSNEAEGEKTESASTDPNPPHRTTGESEPTSRARKFLEDAWRVVQGVGLPVLLAEQLRETLAGAREEVVSGWKTKHQAQVEAEAEKLKEAAVRTRMREEEYASGRRPIPPSEAEIERARKMAEATSSPISAQANSTGGAFGEQPLDTEVLLKILEGQNKLTDRQLKLLENQEERMRLFPGESSPLDKEILKTTLQLIEAQTKEKGEATCLACGASGAWGEGCVYCGTKIQKKSEELGEMLRNLNETKRKGRESPPSGRRLGDLGSDETGLRAGGVPIVGARESGVAKGQKKVTQVDGMTYTEDEIMDIPKMFSKRWLTSRGLPTRVVMKTMFPDQFRVLDMRYMMHQLFSGHPTEGFDAESVRRGLELEARENAALAGREVDFSGITERATDAFNHFMWGDYKVMQLIQRETNGTLRSWVGPDGNSGIINEIKPNMKWVANQILLDPQSRSALRVWVALGGTADENYSNISGMTQEEKLIVGRYYVQFKEMMKVKEYKKLNPDGSPDEREVLMSRQLGVSEMDKVERELVEMGLDSGAVKMTRMVADLIAWNPETVDVRKQFANFDKYLKGDSKANRSLIGRTMYPDPDDRTKAKTFAQDIGGGGIESLLENVRDWSHSAAWLPMAYGGMQGLLKALQVTRDLESGEDLHGSEVERRAAQNKILNDMMVHKEFPPIDTRTADQLRMWPLYKGRGKEARKASRSAERSQLELFLERQLYALEYLLPPSIFHGVEDWYDSIMNRKRRSN